MNIKHRVVKDMKHPLVSAGDVVDKGNIVLMMTEGGFVAPLSSEFGWHLHKAIYEVASRYGTRDWGNVYIGRYQKIRESASRALYKPVFPQGLRPTQCLTL